jgi:hypothetical protein
MLRRAEFAWQENRHAVARRSVGTPVHPEVQSRLYGGLPIMGQFGDCQQLPPVGSKPHFDKTPPKGEANNADAQGLLVFQQLLRPTEPETEVPVVVVMDETQRQKDPKFKAGIYQMRGKGVTRATAEMFMERRLDCLSEEERRDFEDNALYAVPTWKSTIPITIKYLQKLGNPVARVDASYSFYGRTNHAATEVNLPARQPLAVGAVVMLLTNFIVEYNLFNGSVGFIVAIVYADAAGPRVRGAKPAYVVVDFPECTIPPEKVWNPSEPTHIPVPVVTLRCENGCCSMTQIPLRICKAITIYKSQGMTVGEEHVWKKIVVQLPSRSRTPGLEQVALSRATGLEHLALLSTVDSPVTIERMMKIGKGEAYKVRCEFERELRELEKEYLPSLHEMVAQEDPNRENPTFEGGFESLKQWYREKVDSLQ